MVSDQYTDSIDNRKQIINDFLDNISNSIHKRILSAYGFDDPVTSMEHELTKILEEIIDDED